MRSPGRIQDKHLLAIVDGNAKHRAEVSAALLSFYRVTEYADSETAFASLRIDKPDILLVGEEVAPLDGFELVHRLRQMPSGRRLPTIMVLNRDGGSNPDAVKHCGADSHLVKPYRRSTLLKTISSLVNAAIEGKWEALPATQRQALRGTVEVFNSISDVIDKGEPITYHSISEACGPLVEAVNKNDYRSILNGVKDHDNYSYVHCLRVATLLSLFGRTVGLGNKEQNLLASAGLLHDVGKMAIPYQVLNKPGRLTEDEFTVMKGHVDASVHYLRNGHDIPKGVVTIAEQHHEKLDGTGYPHGLKGAQLNDLARMAAIVDVFGALTDRRVYKPPIDAEVALKTMAEEMSTHLDLRLLNLFREMLLDAADNRAA